MDNLEFIINHLGEEREEYYNAVAPPIFQASNFCFKTVADLREGVKNEFTTPFYTRGLNPTVGILRKKLAALEKTDDALVFGSGSAAIASAVMSEVKAGDHIVCVQKPYSWTYKLINNLLAAYGVESTFVDGTDTANILYAVQENTKVIYLESPNSLTFELQDIQAVRDGVGEEMTIMIDNSYSSPIFQNPVDMGANIVLHSASKYLAGHSDLVAGVLCADQERINKIMASEFMTLGGIISPNDAWLLMRGLRTLPVRMREVQRVAKEVIAYLEDHPKIEHLNHPFTKYNPQRELAEKQMSGAGGLFSVLVKTDSIDKVEAFCNNLPSFLITCSWGGYESLQFPTAALYDSMNYDDPDLPWNMIRFYVGLEDPKAIIEEFEKAFELL